MIQNYLARNLNRTVNFLLKTKMSQITSPITLDNDEALAISFQNSGLFVNAYLCLHCPESLKSPFSIVFCKCCSSRKIFLRNHSLTLSENQGSSIIKVEDYRNDPFLTFIEAKVHKSLELTLEVIDQLPDFYEAYLLLAELSNTCVHLEYPSSLIYYLYLKVLKDIEVPEVVKEILECILEDKAEAKIGIKVSEEQLSAYKCIVMNNLNLVAAFYYCSCNSDQAESIFSRVLALNLDLKSGYYDISYFHFYSIILYNKSDTALLSLSENLNNLFSNQFETLVSNGIYQFSIGNFELSRSIFKTALKKAEKHCQSTIPDVYCLIAHNYIKLNNYEDADKSFQKALKANFHNFRILYTVAEGYFRMQRNEVALWYCKRALEKKNDGSIWKLLGRVFTNLGKFKEAEDCLKKAENMNELDAILYLADVYKKTGSADKALDLYKKYADVGVVNREVVINYLIEYYEEQGDSKNSRYYKDLMLQI